jgi:hypothetical protein
VAEGRTSKDLFVSETDAFASASQLPGAALQHTYLTLKRSLPILRRASASTTGPVSPQLEAIARCESGGDPTAIGGGGLYRGKYQFSYDTWQSVGGSGDPAAAPEAEQDRRAAALLARDGAGQWPVCGA